MMDQARLLFLSPSCLGVGPVSADSWGCRDGDSVWGGPTSWKTALIPSREAYSEAMCASTRADLCRMSPMISALMSEWCLVRSR